MVSQRCENKGGKELPLRAAIKHAGARPSLDASRAEKKHYSELVSKDSVGLYGSDPPSYKLFEAGSPRRRISLDSFLNKLLALVAERNPEQFVFRKGCLYEPSELGIEAESELEGD